MLEKGQDYKWYKVTLDFTNNTDNFIVVVGVDSATIDADTEIIRIDDPSGNPIDGFLLKTFGVAANEATLGMPRRMLLPPRYTLNGTASVLGSVVECSSLEKALSIL